MPGQYKRCAQIPVASLWLILLVLTSTSFGQNHRAHISTATPVSRSTVAPSSYEKSLEDKNHELDSIKNALETGRQKIKALRQKEGTEQSQLTQIEQNLTVSEHYLTVLGSQMSQVDKRIADLSDSLIITANNLIFRQKALKKRLRDMYRAGVFDLIPGRPRIVLILSSANVNDFLYRLKYFAGLNAYDNICLGHIHDAKTTLMAQRQALYTEEDRLNGLHKNKSDEQSRLIDEKQTREQVLASVRKEKDTYLAQVAQLEEASKKLGQLIDDLLKKKLAQKKTPISGKTVKPSRPSIKHASLPWPLSGSILVPFGKIVHPVYQTITMSKGIDIGASVGTSVKSVMLGKVLYVDMMRGLGKFIILEHEDGLLTIYAHLGDVMVSRDQVVPAGSVIGTIGKPNPGEESRLHFEIRKDSEPLDPIEWLE